MGENQRSESPNVKKKPPLERDCKWCQGSGTEPTIAYRNGVTIDQEDEDCTTCDGSGKVKLQIKHALPCGWCPNSSGMDLARANWNFMKGKKCCVCLGSGWLYPEVPLSARPRWPS